MEAFGKKKGKSSSGTARGPVDETCLLNLLKKKPVAIRKGEQSTAMGETKSLYGSGGWRRGGGGGKLCSEKKNFRKKKEKAGIRNRPVSRSKRGDVKLERTSREKRGWRPGGAPKGPGEEEGGFFARFRGGVFFVGGLGFLVGGLFFD